MLWTLFTTQRLWALRKGQHSLVLRCAYLNITTHYTWREFLVQFIYIIFDLNVLNESVTDCSIGIFPGRKRPHITYGKNYTHGHTSPDIHLWEQWVTEIHKMHTFIELTSSEKSIISYTVYIIGYLLTTLSEPSLLTYHLVCNSSVYNVFYISTERAIWVHRQECIHLFKVGRNTYWPTEL
jgi:hypothetical protein